MNGKRSKKLLILGAVLGAACLVTLLVLGIEQKQEDIRTSGEVILEIPTDSITAVSWSSDQHPPLSFLRDGEHWTYEEDPAFPVNDDRLQDMLEQFAEFTAAFIIEHPDSLSDYGLDDPTAVIHLETEDKTWEIQLGDFSTMDSQRYVSIGDGNVYLMVRDPYTDFSVELQDLILHDKIPMFDEIVSLDIQGEDALHIDYLADGGPSLREDDRYFAVREDRQLPLDNGLVEGFLQDLRWTTLEDYVTYRVTDEELADFGLDAPQLSVSVTYLDDADEQEHTVTLQVSRDPAELADEGDEKDEDAPITAYARVNDSPIIYQISGEDYEALMACTYDDLRHHEVLPMDYEDIAQFEISLEGQTYTLTAEEDGLRYLDAEVDADDIQNALTALTAKEFTDAPASGKAEISLTLTLDDEAGTQVTISLDRYDGTRCLAVVDGQPFALVDRSSVVDLMEAVHAIVLDQQPVKALS